MTPTSIHSTCTCRFFHQGQCSCPDVTLFVIDDDSHAAGPFRLQQDGARMTFFYCLNGQARIDAQAADGEAFSEEIGKGNSLLFCLNGGFSISRAGKRIQAVGLQLRPECLRLFACQLGFVHDGLRKSSSRTLKGDIPLHLRILLEQILNCRDDGLLRDVFLAHKKYELLYQQIELLDRENSHKCVSPAECRAAHRAYAILLQDIGKPPRLFPPNSGSPQSNTRLPGGTGTLPLPFHAASSIHEPTLPISDLPYTLYWIFVGFPACKAPLPIPLFRASGISGRGNAEAAYTMV